MDVDNYCKLHDRLTNIPGN